MRELAVLAQVNVPVEQTWVWYEFEQTFPDRELLGFFTVQLGGEDVVALALQKVRYHGFSFAWAKHGPVWLVEPTEATERAVTDLLISWLREKSPTLAFVRLHLQWPGIDAHPPVQLVTHDRTVLVELDGGRESINARFKKRMRTQLRQYSRRTPVDISDETDSASQDFAEFHALMQDTATRQGFTPWDEGVYRRLVSVLGAKHARVFAARADGQLVAWALFTLSGSEAAYYYAASTSEGRSAGAPAQILDYAFSELSDEGFEKVDLMGIGSELAPTLSSLTAFKTGFSEQVVSVPAAWDIPVNKTIYSLLISARRTVSGLKSLKSWIMRDRTE